MTPFFKSFFFFFFNLFGYTGSQLQYMDSVVTPRLAGSYFPDHAGMEPVSPELQGRFLTTGPPGKSVTPH